MSDLRARLKAALLSLHERPIDYPEWGMGGALLREFTARERQYANDAVQSEAPADPDQVLFRAMLLQRCITDAETGKPYADGRLAPDGKPAIDPRTRAPIFTVEDIQEIADGRALLFNRLWDDLLELAALGPQAMFSGGGADERGERDQGAGDAGTEDAAGEDEGERPGDTDGGGEVPDGPEQATGDGT